MVAFKNFGLILICATLAASAGYADVPAKLPVPVIAIIDVQRIMQESLAAKSMQQQLETRRSKFQNEIEGEENDLRQAEQDLASARNKLAPTAYSDREQKLHQRFSIVEAHVQARRKALDQASTDSMNEVRAALLDVVDKAAHEHGANIAIVKQQVLWVDQPLDITDEVLKRLDQKLPKIDVVLPAETPVK